MHRAPHISLSRNKQITQQAYKPLGCADTICSSLLDINSHINQFYFATAAYYITCEHALSLFTSLRVIISKNVQHTTFISCLFCCSVAASLSVSLSFFVGLFLVFISLYHNAFRIGQFKQWIHDYSCLLCKRNLYRFLKGRHVVIKTSNG